MSLDGKQFFIVKGKVSRDNKYFSGIIIKTNAHCMLHVGQNISALSILAWRNTDVPDIVYDTWEELVAKHFWQILQ